MLLGRLVLLFTLVPALELWLLIEIGSRIGALSTVAIILGTGILGAAMARAQGLRVLRNVQDTLAAGELPAASLIDGLLILVAAALLVTPGLLTDAVGFACLTPIGRGWIRRHLTRRFERALREGRLQVQTMGDVRLIRRDEP